MNRRHFVIVRPLPPAQRLRQALSAVRTTRFALPWLAQEGRAIPTSRPTPKMKNVEIAALCDIDENILEQAPGRGGEGSGGSVPPATPISGKLLRRQGSSTRSPLPRRTTITRCRRSGVCQAGKHVYCEKPATHNIFEAKQVVAAARKYNKIVQNGVNARSHGGPIEAVQKHARRADRRRLHGPRTLLQTPRHDRPRRSRNPCPPACITTSGWVPLRSTSSPRIASTTTGTGSGTTAMAISATRASTSWISPMGTGREVSDEGQRHRRTFHVRRRSADTEHAERCLRIQ